MGSANRVRLGGFLVAVLARLSRSVTLAKGGFYIGKHEGDTLHLLQIVLREAQGQWPHLDFQTPIGVLATAPIALFVRLGARRRARDPACQVLVAAVALPAIWRVAASRFRGVWAYVFGALRAGPDPRAGAWRSRALGVVLDALQPLGLGRGLSRHRRGDAGAARGPARAGGRRAGDRRSRCRCWR